MIECLHKQGLLNNSDAPQIQGRADEGCLLAIICGMTQKLWRSWIARMGMLHASLKTNLLAFRKKALYQNESEVAEIFI
ncbi:hypothetical protein EMGBS15_16350 [Filimonas sp.]|jgi:hypothetical protein|nr:hypothetical protein EMGBS15_16350 [Filimonas sp.]